MTSNAPPWDLYRSFLSVLRTGSLSAAARAVGLTQPTIGRHISELEAALGVPLFIRSRNGLAATEAALELQPHAEGLEASVAALLRSATGRGATRGTVRITASEIVGAEVLPPILAKLREAHPDIVVELVLSNRMDNLLSREADIAVRMSRPTQQALVARRVGTIEIGSHAHRAYLEKHGVPRTPADLRGHALIGFDRENAFIRSMRAKILPLERSMFSLRSDSDLAQLAAIRAAYGIGMCQVPLARREASLVRVLPKALSLKLETWIVMHSDLRGSARCRVVADALAQGIAAYISSNPTGVD
jgi:DNA-binding transcriptional LysR family regulator